MIIVSNNTTERGISMNDALEDTAREYLGIKRAIDDLTETLKSLDKSIKQMMVDQDLKKLSIDGKSISLVQYPQRSFKVDELRKLISSATFNLVTEPKVSTEMFDSAVKVGKISEEVADQVTVKTPVAQLRVK